MLNARDKKILRAQAQQYRSLFQIGKDGISDNLIATLDDSLRAHELVKLNLLKTAPLSTAEAAAHAGAGHGQRAGAQHRQDIRAVSAQQEESDGALR